MSEYWFSIFLSEAGVSGRFNLGSMSCNITPLFPILLALGISPTSINVELGSSFNTTDYPATENCMVSSPKFNKMYPRV